MPIRCDYWLSLTVDSNLLRHVLQVYSKHFWTCSFWKSSRVKLLNQWLMRAKRPKKRLESKTWLLHLKCSLLSWYHGVMSRVEAEDVLKDHQEGSYLLRVTRDQGRGPDYSLAIKWVNLGEKIQFIILIVFWQVSEGVHASENFQSRCGRESDL